MFEDETVDITCPKCGHLNSILVREFESADESHIVCVSCKAVVKVEAHEFHERLGQVRKELEELQRDADRGARKLKPRPTKDDYQI
jgi:hypothetical protein